MFTSAPCQYDLHPFLIGVQAEFKVMGAGRSNSYRTCTLPPPLKECLRNELIQTFNFGINEVRTAIKDNGDVYFCLTDVADVLEISRSSDLLQVQKDFVKNETPKNRGTLDPKGVEKIPTPTKGGIQEMRLANKRRF